MLPILNFKSLLSNSIYNPLPQEVLEIAIWLRRMRTCNLLLKLLNYNQDMKALTKY